MHNQTYYIGLFFPFLQKLTFEGSKSYWEKGTLKTIYSPLVSRQIGGQESSWQVENLQPKMKYDFNISALFRDGTTGPDQYLTTETLIERKSPL